MNESRYIIVNAKKKRELKRDDPPCRLTRLAEKPRKRNNHFLSYGQLSTGRRGCTSLQKMPKGKGRVEKGTKQKKKVATL